MGLVTPYPWGSARQRYTPGFTLAPAPQAGNVNVHNSLHPRITMALPQITMALPQIMMALPPITMAAPASIKRCHGRRINLQSNDDLAFPNAPFNRGQIAGRRPDGQVCNIE